MEIFRYALSPMKSEILKDHEWFDSIISWKGNDYSVSSIVDAANYEERLRKYTCSIETFFMDYQAPCLNSLISFAEHCVRVADANLNYPLILAPDGYLLDGRHRLVKHLILGELELAVIRLSEMPAPIRPTGDNA